MFLEQRTSLIFYHTCYIDGKDGPPEHQHEAEQYVLFVAINATPRAMNTREVEEASATDDELHNVRRALKIAALMTANRINQSLESYVSLVIWCYAVQYMPNYDPGH